MKTKRKAVISDSEKSALAVSQVRKVQGVTLLVLIAVALFLLPEMAGAQCAMCRAVTESNQNSNDAFTVGNGLNNAIVYLMFMPYILAMIFVYAFFRKPIKTWLKKKVSSN